MATPASSYYRGAQGVILVYDVTNRDSFTNLHTTWLPELETYAPSPHIVKMVVANKVDRRAQAGAAQVTREEGAAFAREHGALFIEASAKTTQGVVEAFEELCTKVYETPVLWRKDDAAASGVVNVEGKSSNGDDDYGMCAC